MNDGENNVNFARRDVLSADMILRRNQWGVRIAINLLWAGCSGITDACFNACSLCSFNRITKYIDYIWRRNQRTKIAKPTGLYTRFVTGYPDSRDSAHATVIPIWVSTKSEPVKVRLISGRYRTTVRIRSK